MGEGEGVGEGGGEGEGEDEKKGGGEWGNEEEGGGEWGGEEEGEGGSEGEGEDEKEGEGGGGGEGEGEGEGGGEGEGEGEGGGEGEGEDEGEGGGGSEDEDERMMQHRAQRWQRRNTQPQQTQQNIKARIQQRISYFNDPKDKAAKAAKAAKDAKNAKHQKEYKEAITAVLDDEAEAEAEDINHLREATVSKTKDGVAVGAVERNYSNLKSKKKAKAEAEAKAKAKAEAEAEAKAEAEANRSTGRAAAASRRQQAKAAKGGAAAAAAASLRQQAEPEPEAEAAEADFVSAAAAPIEAYDKNILEYLKSGIENQIEDINEIKTRLCKNYINTTIRKILDGSSKTEIKKVSNSLSNILKDMCIEATLPTPYKKAFLKCFNKHPVRVRAGIKIQKQIMNEFGISSHGSVENAITRQNGLFDSAVTKAIHLYNTKWRTENLSAELLKSPYVSDVMEKMAKTCKTNKDSNEFNGPISKTYFNKVLNEDRGLKRNREDQTVILFKQNQEIMGFFVVVPFMPIADILNDSLNNVQDLKNILKTYTLKTNISGNRSLKHKPQIIKSMIDYYSNNTGLLTFAGNPDVDRYNTLLDKDFSKISIMDVLMVCSKRVHPFDLIADLGLNAHVGAIIMEPAQNYDKDNNNTGELICKYLQYGFSPIQIKLNKDPNNVRFMITTPIILDAAVKMISMDHNNNLSGGGGDSDLSVPNLLHSDTNTEFDFSEHVVAQAVDAFNRMQAVEDGCNLRVESVGQRSNTREPPPKLLEAANIPHSHMNTDFVSHVWKNITGYKRRGEMRGFVFTAVSSVTATASATPGATESTESTESTGPIVGALIVAPFEPHFVSSEAKRAELRRMTIPQLTTFLGDRRINIPEISEAGLKESLVNMAVEQIDDSAFTNMGDMFRVMRPRGAFDELIEFDEFNQAMNHPHKAVRLLDLVLIISPGHGDDVMRFVNQLVEMSRATGVVVEPPPGNKPVENALTVMHDFKKLPGGFVRSTSVAGLIGGWVPDSRVLLFKPSGFI